MAELPQTPTPLEPRKQRGIIDTALTGDQQPVDAEFEVSSPTPQTGGMTGPLGSLGLSNIITSGLPTGGGALGGDADNGEQPTTFQNFMDELRQQQQQQKADDGLYKVESMVGKVERITPETIEATGYTPVDIGQQQTAGAVGYVGQGYEAQLAPEAIGYMPEGYEAEGYEALQGIAQTTQENVSQAIQRITGSDSPIMQRAVAQATAEANRRGLLNSSMAAGAAQGAILDRAMQIAQSDVQSEQFNVAQLNAMEAQNIQMGNEALRFTADARNQASAFLANAENRAAEFLAAETNQNGRFNAEQANRAAEFSANAANQAAQFFAAAQNQASIFNAGEANRMSMFTAEQANLASRFAAEMQQAANQFNATAFNQAEQRYADAMNAALAAEVDATNQSRRDLAIAERNMSMANAEMRSGPKIIIGAGGGAGDAEQRQIDFQREQMGFQSYQRYIADIEAIMRDTSLTQEGRENRIRTRTSLESGNPWARVDIRT